MLSCLDRQRKLGCAILAYPFASISQLHSYLFVTDSSTHPADWEDLPDPPATVPIDSEADHDQTAESQRVTIGAAQQGLRLDQALASLLPQYSRSRLSLWIRLGQVLYNGATARPKDTVSEGGQVRVIVAPEPDRRCHPEAIPLEICYEDRDILVVHKPAGLVTHPAAGNWSGTLQNALLHHDPAQARLPRAGIVHRLDKDTSGLLVVAKTLEAHASLVTQLQRHSLSRQYLAVIRGTPVGGGRMDAPIGRHPQDRLRMAVVANGKPAVTHYRILERFRGHCLVDIRLETGRTHQIRVHFSQAGYPLVGDPLYGGRSHLPKHATPELIEQLQSFGRQALHATHLGLIHPGNGQPMEWSAPPPADFLTLLETLRTDRTDRDKTS
ncbi:23S rRNA pseudouridine(1911/1915/1917) synthase [Gammaproteobacteria bacterium]